MQLKIEKKSNYLVQAMPLARLQYYFLMNKVSKLHGSSGVVFTNNSQTMFNKMYVGYEYKQGKFITSHFKVPVVVYSRFEGCGVCCMGTATATCLQFIGKAMSLGKDMTHIKGQNFKDTTTIIVLLFKEYNFKCSNQLSKRDYNKRAKQAEVQVFLR